MPNHGVSEMIVETLSHLRGTKILVTGMFSPSYPGQNEYSGRRLLRPHIEVITMTGTGTRQPTCCGKRPKAVGQSVMTLPGNSPLSTPHDKFHMRGWLVRAATDRNEGRTAVVVRDGNTVHTAKGCRLRGLLEPDTLRITSWH